jgi:hypothetical protein
MASFHDQLSPHEEATLGLIAGRAPEEFRPADVARLTALGLVCRADGVLIVTKAGAERRAGEITLPASLHRRRRLKVRQLPF